VAGGRWPVAGDKGQVPASMRGGADLAWISRTAASFSAKSRSWPLPKLSSSLIQQSAVPTAIT